MSNRRGHKAAPGKPAHRHKPHLALPAPPRKRGTARSPYGATAGRIRASHAAIAESTTPSSSARNITGSAFTVDAGANA